MLYRRRAARTLPMTEDGRLLDGSTLVGLDRLPAGSSATIAAPTSTEDALQNRLNHLGFRAGETVTVRRVAPLGDPVVYAVCGAEVCLRRVDAAHIAVETATISPR